MNHFLKSVRILATTFLLSSSFLFALPLPVHADDTGTNKSTLVSMSNSDMRKISGRKGLTFDTMTIDGTLEERIPVLTEDNGSAGFYIGPIDFKEIVIGQPKVGLGSGTVIGGQARDESLNISMGPIRGGFSTELLFSLNQNQLSSAGEFAIGGSMQSRQRAEAVTN